MIKNIGRSHATAVQFTASKPALPQSGIIMSEDIPTTTGMTTKSRDLGIMMKRSQDLGIMTKRSRDLGIMMRSMNVGTTINMIVGKNMINGLMTVGRNMINPLPMINETMTVGIMNVVGTTGAMIGGIMMRGISMSETPSMKRETLMSTPETPEMDMMTSMAKALAIKVEESIRR